MKQKLFIISSLDLNINNNASISRISNYARALESYGTEVILSSRFNTRSAELIKLNNQGVKMKCIGMPLFSPRRNFWKKYFDDFYFLSYFKYIRFLDNYSRSSNSNFVFLHYQGSFAMSIMSLLYLKFYKSEKVFLEKNELLTGIAINFPLTRNVFTNILLIPYKLNIIILNGIQDLISPLFSGMIVISRNLKKLYQPFGKHILRIPILCIREEIKVRKIPNKKFTIGYAGEINQQKDGLLFFLKILGDLKEDFEFRFEIWGSFGSRLNHKRFEETIERLEISEVVRTHSGIKHSDLLQKLVNCDLLVLPRPDNLQTNFGFSTKLAHYMMTGIPVLVTKISDNDLYIRDGINGFVVKPDDFVLMRNKMQLIFTSSKENLNQIGCQGRITAENVFNPENYSSTLKAFLFN